MENPKLSENRISIILDDSSLPKNQTDGLGSILQKTKLDIEFLLLGSDETIQPLQDWVEKGKVKYQKKDNTPLNAQFASLLGQSTASTTLIIYPGTHWNAGLLQTVNLARKGFKNDGISIGSRNITAKGSNNKVALGTKVQNSFIRLFTSLAGTDNSNGILAGKTNVLQDLYQKELGSGNTFQQTFNLAVSSKIPYTEFSVPADCGQHLSWGSIVTSVFSLRFQYFVKDSLWQLKNKEVSLNDGMHPAYKLAYFALFIITFFAMPLLSRDFGSTWDEKAHNEYSQLAYNYLTTFGEDTMALAEPTSSANYIRQAYRFYGEQMNTIAAFTYNWLGTGVYETRHAINSLYGLIGIIFTSLLAFELAGWRAACLGLLFMFLNPGWLGHSMNNPTDIPFATGFAFAGYFMVKVMRSLPAPKFRNIFWLAFGLGIGLASRVGAFLILAYLGLFLGVNWLDKIRNKEKNTAKLIWPYAKILLWVGLFGYILGILIWPYALDNPFKHPIQAFTKAAENAFYTNNVEIFEGKRMYMITSAPWYYVFKFLGMGNPLYLLAGLLVAIIGLIPISKKIGIGNYLMLFFMLLFPILYAEYSNLNYYNGWRHYLFVLPFAVPLAAVAWDYLLSLKKPLSWISLAVFAIMFGKPLVWVVQNHPNEYVYFNELIGGLKGAYGDYETDYYSNSCREAAEWIAKKHPKDSLVIGINNETTTASYWAHQINPRLNFVWTREMEEQKLDWDYLILTTRTFSKNELENGSFPPKGTVYTVEAEGVPLAAVVKRENHFMPLGYKALDKQNFDSSIFYFEQAVKYAPYDEESWRMLGFSLINRSRMDSAEMMLKKAIEIYPENFTAYNNLGLVYFNKKEFQKAIEAFKKSTDLKENVTESWYYGALAYLNLGDYPNGIKFLEMAVKHNAGIPEVYYYLAKAYNATGNYQKAADNYQIALGMNQNFAAAWLELSEVFKKLNQPDYAQQCIQRYQALGGH